MSIKHSIWKINNKPELLKPGIIDSENLLEDKITEDISILNREWLLIGRQIQTDVTSKDIDLLAIDIDGNIIVIELKRSQTPRDVIAQALDYTSYISKLNLEEIDEIYNGFRDKYIKNNNSSSEDMSLEQAFKNKFGVSLTGDEDKGYIVVNKSQKIIIVATELDQITERMIDYLNENSNGKFSINALLFSFFEDNGNKYISRSWLTEPEKVEEKIDKNTGKWNGEYYCNYGTSERRSWNDATKYGFVSAGGGIWYSRTLGMLEPGNRIWVRIPGKGYVGVAKVEDKKLEINEFLNKYKDISSFEGEYFNTENPDDNEYFVKVKWLYHVKENEAEDEKGFFGNQNTVARPKSDKWQTTINALSKKWNINLDT